MFIRKVAFIIDGWFMYKRTQSLKLFDYNGKNIRNYCKKLLRTNDYLYRIYYYDTLPLNKKGEHPLTRRSIDFSKTEQAKKQTELLESIKKTPLFALRLGTTYWENNAWTIRYDRLKELLKEKISVSNLEETDIKPLIKQKSVDLKIGLDIASLANKRIVDVIIVITGDSDIIPALKHARKEGIQIGLDTLENKVRPELEEHVDFKVTAVHKYNNKQ